MVPGIDDVAAPAQCLDLLTVGLVGRGVAEEVEHHLRAIHVPEVVHEHAHDSGAPGD